MLCKMTRCFGLPTEPGLPTRRTSWEQRVSWQRLPLKWKLGFEVRCQVRHRGLDSCRCVPDYSAVAAPGLCGGKQQWQGPGVWVQICTFSAQCWPFKYFQVKIAIFPLASAMPPQGQPFKKVGVLRRLKRRRFGKGGQVIGKRG